MKNLALSALATFSSFVCAMQHEPNTWHIPKEICVIIAAYASSSDLKISPSQGDNSESQKTYRSKWEGTHMCNDEIIKKGLRYEYKEPQFGFKQLSLNNSYPIGNEYDFIHSNMVIDHSYNHRIASENFRGTLPASAGSEGILSHYFRLRCHYKVLRHEKAECLAVSQKNLVALHTRYREDKSDVWMPRLRIFSYALRSREQQEENGLPRCTLTPLVFGNTHFTLKFKKMAWIYGKVLLELLESGSLYLINIPDGLEKIARFDTFRQKLPFLVDNFAVHQPFKNHEIIIKDTKNALYFAALNDRTADGKIRYRKIWGKCGFSNLKDLWFYNNVLCLVNSKRECAFMPLGDKKEYAPLIIHQKLLPLYRLVAQKKEFVCNQKGLLFEEYEPANL